MLYLDKWRELLLTKMRARYTLPREEKPGVALSFAIDSIGAEELERKEGMIPRAIAKANGDYLYIVGSGMGSITAVERKAIEEAKREAIDAASESEELAGSNSLSSTQSMAFGSLAPKVGQERARFLSYLVAQDTVGYGPIGILMDDRESIEEIEINTPNSNIKVYHVKYGRCTTNMRFEGEAAFRHCINKLVCDADKELSDDTPIVEAQVKGARVHAQIRPYALSGAAASIRLSGSRVVTPDFLVSKGTTNCDVLAYLWLALEGGVNIVISGAPASGKTTLLSALFTFIPKYEKIVTVEEDIDELKMRLDINNTVSLCGSKYGNKASTREQVINALRMRPSRLVLGEVRGDETKELFSCANLGVPFITTMHSSEGGAEVLKKLLVKPMSVEPKSLSMLDLVIYMKQIDISKRLLDEIYEYRWLSRAETEKVGFEIEGSDSVDISRTAANGTLNLDALKASKVIEAFSRKKGISSRLVLKELEKRSRFLSRLCGSRKPAPETIEIVNAYRGR